MAVAPASRAPCARADPSAPVPPVISTTRPCIACLPRPGRARSLRRSGHPAPRPLDASSGRATGSTRVGRRRRGGYRHQVDGSLVAYHGRVTGPSRERRGEWELSWPVLVGFVLLLSLGFLGTRGLWEPDEGRYAAVAWEMVASGDYLTPTLNG